MLTQNRFLIQFHHTPVIDQIDAVIKEPKPLIQNISANTLEGVLFELLKCPPDLFDIETAKRNQYHSYISDAIIMQLDTASLLYRLRMELPGTQLAMAPGLYLEAIRRNPLADVAPHTDHENSISGDGALTYLLSIDDNRTYLTPTPLFFKLLEAVGQKLDIAGEPESRFRFCNTSFSIDLQNAGVINDRLLYQSVALQHIYPSAPHAILQMASQPPACYDQQKGYENGYPYFHFSAMMEFQGDTTVTVAEIVNRKPNETAPDDPQLVTGLHLMISKPVLESVLKNGPLSPPKLENGGPFVIVPLVDYENYLKLSDTFRPEAIALFHLIRQNYPQEPTYQLYQYIQPNYADIQLHNIPTTANQATYSHSEDLQELIGVFLQEPLICFDRRLVDTMELPFQLVECHVSDNQKRMLLSYEYKNEKDLFFDRGVYLRVHPALNNIAGLDRLQWDLLQCGDIPASFIKDDITYYQVAGYQSDFLRVNDGMLRLMANSYVTNKELAGMIDGHLRWKSNEVQLPDPAYVIKLEWKVPDGRQAEGERSYTVERSFDTIDDAMAMLVETPGHFFDPGAVVEQRLPLLLDKVSLSNREGQPVVSKGKDIGQSNMIYFEFYEKADSTVFDAYHRADRQMAAGKKSGTREAEGQLIQLLSKMRTPPPPNYRERKFKM